MGGDRWGGGEWEGSEGEWDGRVLSCELGVMGGILHCEAFDIRGCLGVPASVDVSIHDRLSFGKYKIDT